MNRKEQIKQAAESFDIQIISNPWTLFEKGAEWADCNPNKDNLSTAYKIGKNEVIEKACEWLNNNIFYDEVEGWNVNSHPESTEELIKQFKKAMEL